MIGQFQIYQVNLVNNAPLFVPIKTKLQKNPELSITLKQLSSQFKV
jgi:hypothetical protein